MKKTRSRAYPALSLEEAYKLFLDKLPQLDAKPYSREEIAIAIGYSSSSGGIAGRKVAALVQYGFIERHNRKYALSKFGDYVRSLESRDPDLESALRRAFFRPPLFKEIVTAYEPYGELPNDLRELLGSKFRIAPKVCPQVEDIFVASAMFANILNAGRKFLAKEDQQRLTDVKRSHQGAPPQEPRGPGQKDVHELKLEKGESVVEWRFPMRGGASSAGVALMLPPNLTEADHVYIANQLPRIAESLRDLRPPISPPRPQPVKKRTKEADVFLKVDLEAS